MSPGPRPRPVIYTRFRLRLRLLLRNGKLYERLADEHWRGSPCEQRLVLQLQSQFLLLCLQDLDLLVQVIVQQVLCVLRL